MGLDLDAIDKLCAEATSECFSYHYIGSRIFHVLPQLVKELRAARAVVECQKHWVHWWNGPGRDSRYPSILPPLLSTAKVLEDYDATVKGCEEISEK